MNHVKLSVLCLAMACAAPAMAAPAVGGDDPVVTIDKAFVQAYEKADMASVKKYLDATQRPVRPIYYDPKDFI